MQTSSKSGWDAYYQAGAWAHKEAKACMRNPGTRLVQVSKATGPASAQVCARFKPVIASGRQLTILLYACAIPCLTAGRCVCMPIYSSFLSE